jgi:hypothetical protein
MPRGQQGKANRKARRAQDRRNEKDRARQAPAPSQAQPQSQGWMSMLWGGNQAESETGAELELGKGEVNQHESDLGQVGSEKAEEAEGGGSWWDYVPSLKWGSEEELEGYGSRQGDEDNHVDTLTSKDTRKIGLELGPKGAAAELEYEKSRKLADISGKAEGEVGPLSGELETNVALGHAQLGAKGKLEANRSGVSGEAEVGAGMYAMSGEAEGEIGMKVPFVNARLFGKGSVGGNVGVGAKAEGHFTANAEQGYSAGGKLGASAGVGGEVGWGMGVKKADPKKGWFE